MTSPRGNTTRELIEKKGDFHTIVCMNRIGSHVERENPLTGAKLRGAEVVQINLSAPQTWQSPKSKGDEEMLAKSEIPIWVHAPYLVNPSSINEDVLQKSKSALITQSRAAARINAKGLVVHGGHPTGNGSVDDAIDNWLRVLDGWEPETMICIENTAGGKAAAARNLETLNKLFERLKKEGHACGFVFDTCHAFAGGITLTDTVKEVVSAIGRIDLLHLNDSKDQYNSSRDRHENLGDGQIDPDWLIDVLTKVDCDVVVETPGGYEAQRDDILWVRERVSKYNNKGAI